MKLLLFFFLPLSLFLSFLSFPPSLPSFVLSLSYSVIEIQFTDHMLSLIYILQW